MRADPQDARGMAEQFVPDGWHWHNDGLPTGHGGMARETDWDVR